jgi:NADP-dependent 3-hydroxy acid dehydrogenase YdfG
MANRTERSVDGLVVAITGAARGIGLAAAQALSAAGAKVAIGDLDGDLAASAAKTLPNEAVGLALDVTERESFDAFLTATEQQLGPLDVLVNNAGVMFVGSFFEEDESALRRMTEVNLYGTLTGIQLAHERMRKRSKGHIVNVVSMASWICAPGEASYSATKHAVKGACEALRLELEGTGIDLSLIYPAVVQTELASGTTSGRSKMLQPEDVGAAILKTIQHPRHDVFVPGYNAPLIRFYVALPARARTRMAKLFGVDKIATGADTKTARAEYEQRLGGR